AAPATGSLRSRSSALRQYFGAALGCPAIGSDRRFARSLVRASWLSSQLIASSSSMAGGAARPRLDVVLGRLRPPGFLGIALGRPLHVRDFLDGADVRLGTAVAFQAPAHGQRRGLLDGGLLIDAPVAGDAADALVHVDRVIEVDELGQLVDPVPLDRR